MTVKVIEMSELEVPIPDEHFRLIGRITVHFALLEDVISRFIWHFISSEQRLGQIITAELSFRGLLALLSSLHKHRVTDPETLAELDKLLKQATRAEEKRNLIIHSCWAGDEGETDTALRIKFTAKKSKGFKFHSEEMAADDLAEICDFIDEIVVEVEDFMGRHGVPGFEGLS